MAVRIPLGNRLGSIDDQVEEHLPEPRFVPLHRRHLGIFLDQLGAMADFVPGHSKRRLQHAVHVDGAARLLVRRAREDLEIADDVPDPVGALPGIVKLVQYFRQAIVQRRTDGHSSQVSRHQLEVGEDGSERIVDLVGHAGRQRSHRGHAIGDEKLLLHGALPGPPTGFSKLSVDGGTQPAQAALEDVIVGAASHRFHRRPFSDGAGNDDEGDVER